MLIAVDCGHCPKSTGANGYLNELTEDRKLGKALIAELKARGHKVVDVTPADKEAESLSGRAKRANAAKADFFCSVHFNAGGGTGTEVYTTASSGAKAEAKKVSAAVAGVLGLKNRGHKTASFTVLVKTSMPAILVETCFVDTKKDADAYKATSVEEIAAAIAYGIAGGTLEPVAGVNHPDPVEEEKVQEVCTVTLPVVGKGDKGEAVRTAQMLLKFAGYDVGKYGADGDFGNDTLAAVKALQKARKLTQTGEVDKKTWAALLGV